jgi:uncharacterized protein YjbI with pentapeptide repeats
MRTVFFEAASFLDCNFNASDLQYVSFAGSLIRKSVFTSAVLKNSNFSGSLILDSAFTHSDLSSSRFINANIRNTLLNDCELTAVMFIGSQREAVCFTSSSTQKAIYDLIG